MHNYVGSQTENAKIPVGTGVCGTAIAEKKNLNIPDVRKFENYVMYDPDVQSELVVLIRAGDDVFGEIAVESEDAKAFKAKDEAAVQAVADTLAEQLVAERRVASHRGCGEPALRPALGGHGQRGSLHARRDPLVRSGPYARRRGRPGP